MRMTRKLLIGGITATILTAPVANAWPTVEQSGCVASGQTPEFCIGKFMESIETISPISENLHQAAVDNGLRVVASMERSFDPGSHSLPPREMFKDAVGNVMAANPEATWDEAIFFVKMSIHWFGPPGLETAVANAMNA